MPKKVPYLQEEQIERDAAALLSEFAQARSVMIAPPGSSSRPLIPGMLMSDRIRMSDWSPAIGDALKGPGGGLRKFHRKAAGTQIAPEMLPK